MPTIVHIGPATRLFVDAQGNFAQHDSALQDNF